MKVQNKVPKIFKIFDPNMILLDYHHLKFFWLMVYLRIKKYYYTNKPSTKGSLFFMSNHEGRRDPIIILAAYVFKRIRVLGTSALFHNLPSKYFYTIVGILKVNKDTLNRKLIKKMYKTIRYGHSIGVFPEGHLNHSYLINDFQPGLVKMAMSTNTDILSMYINHENRHFLRQRVLIGKRFCINDLVNPGIGERENAQTINEYLKNHLQELKDYFYEKILFSSYKDVNIYLLHNDRKIDFNVKLPLNITDHINQYNNQHTKNMSLRAWQYLSYILNKYHNKDINQDAISFIKDKPFFSSGDIYFNISHTSDMVAIIIGKHEVAIDIEMIDNNSQIVAAISKLYPKIIIEKKSTSYLFKLFTQYEVRIKNGIVSNKCKIISKEFICGKNLYMVSFHSKTKTVDIQKK